jgi:predicted aconitase with swiveling domain
MKEFHGRVIFGGTYKGKAVVSRQGFNTLATFEKSGLKKKCNELIGGDHNNPDVNGVSLTGIALCLPQTIGSTTGGMLIQSQAKRGITPACWLYSKEVDPISASGLILTEVWEKIPVIVIDQLGDEFLQSVKTGAEIEIKEDGTVLVP